ncbi:uncharacterized protein LOC124259624 isoform X2 [Haliotis rubra]|uniref:uncharacterized protein LOC124259624 isoform X2 n=1 Tax=Haliotis rubra TaxID=36100 RepID=UPI001EE5D835|nr:uncharacterized protein LOC124259624 isoform X2 [Haliotis rubra]
MTMDYLTYMTLAILLLSSVYGKEYSVEGFWVTEKDIGSDVLVSEMNQTLSWATSESTCRRLGGHLYVEASGDTVGSLAGRLEEDTPYWVGGTVVTPSWYWEGTQDRLYPYIGYISSSNIRKIRTTHYEDNQAFTCFTFCNSMYVALKDTECVCLRDDPTPVDSSISSLLCPGNIEERCGDPDGYSVYSDKLSQLEKFRQARQNDFRYVWGLLEINGGSQPLRIATTDSQTDTWMALCGSTSQDVSVPMDAIIAPSTRQQARETCKGELLQVRGRRNSLQAGRYWIGLRRSFSWIWITGKAVTQGITNASLPYRCLSVRKRGSSVRVENQDCSKPLRYICLTDTNSPGSPEGEGFGWALPTGVAGAAAALIIIIAATAGCCRRLKSKRVTKVKHEKARVDVKRLRRESTDVEYSEVRDSTTIPASPDSFAAEEDAYQIPYNAELGIGGRGQPSSQAIYSHAAQLGGAGATDYDVTGNRGNSTRPLDDYDHIGSHADQSESQTAAYDTPRSTRKCVDVAEVEVVNDEGGYRSTDTTCFPVQVSYSERENTGLQYDTPRRGSPLSVAHGVDANVGGGDRGVNVPAYDVPRSDRVGHVIQL